MSQLRVQANVITNGTTEGKTFTAATGESVASLTFGTGKITVSGNLEVSQLDVTTVKQFAGDSITLTKVPGSKQSYYGSAAESLDEIATVRSADSLQTRFSTADNSLETRISSEVVNRSTADDSLQTRFSTADNSLETRISSEEVNRSTADDSLQTRFSTADNSLETRISSEEVNRSTADDSLQTRFSTADNSLETRISSEEVTRSNLHQSLTNFANYEGSAFSLKVNGDIEATGNIVGASHVTTSDARLKKDVEDVTGALDMVSRMHPVFYNWNDGTKSINPGHKELGFLAQEVEAVLPSVIHTSASGDIPDLKRVAYDRLVAVLFAAVKELKGEVDSLKHA